jgi:hypothetical protein
MLFDQIGIGTESIGTNTLQVGSGSSSFFVGGSGNTGIGTNNTQGYQLYVEGTIYGSFVGDGSALTNLDSIWAKDYTSEWIFTKEDPDFRIGIGASTGITAQLQIAGTAATSLYVTNGSRFISTATFESEVAIGGTLTATKFNLNSPSQGYIQAGVTTSSIIHVGTAGTVFNAVTSTGNVGVGTSVARAKLDVEGTTRLKTYFEHVHSVTSASNVVSLDLSEAQNFTLTANENVDYFVITNTPSETSSFTIKIAQDGTGSRVVDIDDFRTSGGSSIPVYWPGGGVLPIVTSTANRSDIYSFKTFDGGSTWYGVVVGQNFA